MRGIVLGVRGREIVMGGRPGKGERGREAEREVRGRWIV